MPKIDIQTADDLGREYDNIKKIDMVPVRASIIEKCKISKEVFYNWLGNRSSIPELAKPILNGIFEERQNSYLEAISDEK